MYSYLTLLIFLVLVEDPSLAKLLCETSAPVRLCRQRPPYLPVPKPDRPYAASVVDLLTDAINHNLRRRLDTSFYILTCTCINTSRRAWLYLTYADPYGSVAVTVLSKFLSYLAKTRTKLVHHWSELWRSLLAFVRFLTTYADDLKFLARTAEVVQALVVH
jgi:hypothetical protein